MKKRKFFILIFSLFCSYPNHMRTFQFPRKKKKRYISKFSTEGKKKKKKKKKKKMKMKKKGKGNNKKRNHLLTSPVSKVEKWRQSQTLSFIFSYLAPTSLIHTFYFLIFSIILFVRVIQKRWVHADFSYISLWEKWKN